jgi:hypothetical protein
VLFDPSIPALLEFPAPAPESDVVSSAPFALEFGAGESLHGVQLPLIALESPAIAPKIDARTLPYTGPFPRKRHYHRCPKCRVNGSGGVACYMAKCTRPVLMSVACGFCGGAPRPRG